jgi:asparagine synthase (glutamine-hydrolysing)
MCGLTGYLLKNSFEKNNQTIIDMLSLQKHRGPDDSGILGINFNENYFESSDTVKIKNFEKDVNLIFGFNRLSILDLSTSGHQPMINLNAKVALMLNGEIYNAFDYKDELITKGYKFYGTSDTEILLNLYLEYGLDGMLSRLNGMYAIAIYDGIKKNIFLIRDRFGIKPLYVSEDENRLVFSSEMKSFKALPNFKFELDESKISEFLVFRNLINQTLFKNIFNITPGTYLIINEFGEIKTSKYFDVSCHINHSTEINHQQNLEIALRNSVKRQMISDVKLGCQLSGGIDSSMITAFGAELYNQNSFQTVSILFDDSKFSEKKYIDFVFNKFNLSSHQFNLDENLFMDLFDEAIWNFEQPLNHPNTIAVKLLSREARKHLTVLLSGEGADEVLFGYSRFLPGSDSFFSRKTFYQLKNNSNQLLLFLSVFLKKNNRYIMQSSFGSLSNVSKLFSKFSIKDALKSRQEIWSSILIKQNTKKRLYELLTFLPDLLMRQDKMSMAHSIECRVPFLDNEMFEESMKFDYLQLVKKYNGAWQGKFILKKICSEIFGHSFSFRPKMSFSIPLNSFISSNIFQKRWSEEFLPGIQKRGIFNADTIDYWLKNKDKLSPDKLDAIWLMVGFEIWAKQYLD